MNTVTRLKIEVENDNLPVLVGGKMLNYYVGKYLNRVVELGYTPTDAEKAAISQLIDNAIAHDWLKYVDYFFPFIGNKENFVAGSVPLIDRYDDYVGGFDPRRATAPSDELQKTAFTYDENDKIVSYGNITLDVSNILPSGIVTRHVYKNFRGAFFAFDPTIDYSSLFANSDIPIYTQFISQPQTDIIGKERATTYESWLLWKYSNKVLVGKKKKTGATEQTNSNILPSNDIRTYTTKYLSYINITKNGEKYSQCTITGSGNVLRNYDGADSTEPDNIEKNATLGWMASQGGNIAYATPSLVPMYSAAIFNDVTTRATNLDISRDILNFNIAIGKIEAEEPEE